MNATMPSRASVTTWKATSRRLWRFTIAVPAGAVIVVVNRVHRSRVTKRSRLKRSACCADAPRVPRRCRGAAQAVGQRFFTRLDQHARLAVDHRFQRAAAAERDHRPAARLRLRAARCRSPLRPGRIVAIDERYRSRISSLRAPAEEPHVVAAERLEPRAFRSVADDRQRHAGPAGRGDGEIDAFVGHERRNDRETYRQAARLVTSAGV